MSTTTTVSPLEELLQRAGASDQDRPAWLAERRRGVTATEIKDLYMGGPGAKSRLVSEKLAAADSFGGSKWTEHGKKREPIIAAMIESRYGIRPESRVFHAIDNVRFLASPDGIGEDFDGNVELAEVKTGKYDTTIGSEHYAEVGYHVQMQWQMRVTGARRTLYVFEQHDDVWPDPTPFEAACEWVEYDPAMVADLEAIALDFLAALDEAVSGAEVLIDEQMDYLAVNLLRFRELEADAAKSKAETWVQMLARAEGCDEFSQRSAFAQVTWNPGTESETTVPDMEAAVAAAPGLAADLADAQKAWADHQAKFTKTVTTTGKSTLTVTSVKDKKEKK